MEPICSVAKSPPSSRGTRTTMLWCPSARSALACFVLMPKALFFVHRPYLYLHLHPGHTSLAQADMKALMLDELEEEDMQQAFIGVGIPGAGISARQAHPHTQGFAPQSEMVQGPRDQHFPQGYAPQGYDPQGYPPQGYPPPGSNHCLSSPSVLTHHFIYGRIFPWYVVRMRAQRAAV